MHFIPSGPGSWFSLPRKNGVAFAAQESWVQNETIRVCSKLLYYKLGLTGAPYHRIIFCSALHMMKNDIIKVQIKIDVRLNDGFNLIYSVIYQCGLERDLTLFDAGDKTEVGERGLTLR